MYTCVPVCGFIYVSSGMYRSQKKMAEPLETEWQAVMNLSDMGAGIKRNYSRTAVLTLNNGVSFLALYFSF